VERQTHETNSTVTRRPGLRRDDSWLSRQRGSGFTSFRMRQLGVLAAAIGLLVSLTQTGAQAVIAGPRVANHLTAEQRRLEAATLRALQAAKFASSSGHFGGHHHGHPLPDPTPTTTLPPVTTTTLPPATTTTLPATDGFPVGVTDSTEPSGMAPPDPGALAGYTQSYVTDFAGSSLPSGWEVFTGNPGGDPGAQWGASHVTVSDGTLDLNTWKDPAYGNEWVTGGLCQCGVAQTYGAYFVRSRVTGAGPSQVELLWPTGNRWPPEIDFDESSGTTNETTATLHFSSANKQDQRSLNVDLTQWHTWGVIWTPDAVTYTVDGRVWGSVHVASEISAVPMTLDLTQQTWCSSFWACPNAPQSMLVDWVAEYTAS
jgi:Glycosyl hydrolases family 16